MRLLLTILLAILLEILAGCSAPSPLVSKLALASLAASSRTLHEPASEPAVIADAGNNLHIAATCLWVGVPPSRALEDKAAGRDIEAALPKPSLSRDDVRAMDAAAFLLRQ